MFSVVSGLSHGLGAQRRLIRRIGALCLIVMGVHAAADHLDDVVYTVLDALDLVVDEAFAGLMDALAGMGALTTEGALRASEAFATFVDLGEKDWLALRLALIVELVLDVLLLDLAWGRHMTDEAHGLLDELRASGAQLWAALRPFDLERVAVLPTLFGFALGGALVGALAVEGVVRDLLTRLVPMFLWSSSVAAGVGVLAAALLVWRFVPDLLHGALLRSQQRAERARQRADERAAERRQRQKAPPRFPQLRGALTRVDLATRGAWIALLALPLAASGLLSSDIAGLVQRATPTPADVEEPLP